jgi:hypothetical protein
LGASALELVLEFEGSDPGLSLAYDPTGSVMYAATGEPYFYRDRGAGWERFEVSVPDMNCASAQRTCGFADLVQASQNDFFWMHVLDRTDAPGILAAQGRQCTALFLIDPARECAVAIPIVGETTEVDRDWFNFGADWSGRTGLVIGSPGTVYEIEVFPPP